MKVKALLGAVLVASLSLCPQVEARPWNPKPSALALDYLQIIDQKAKNQVVLLWWVAPPMMPESPAAGDLLDKYIVMAVVDAHIEVGGTATFTQGNVELKDGAGASLKQIADADMPPALSGVMVAMRGTMAQTLGSMGQGMHLLAYEAGSVHACTKGQLSVVYGGVTYTYDTPVPGCQAS